MRNFPLQDTPIRQGGNARFPDNVNFLATHKAIVFAGNLGIFMPANVVPDATRAAFERLLFQHARDGIMLVRVETQTDGAHQFHIEMENPAAVERLRAIGQDDDFAGRDVADALPTWLNRKIAIHYEACVVTREVRRYEIVKPNSGMMHESIATPIFGADGKEVEYIMVVMRDIADRVLQEKKLNAALAKAEEANRSKSEFFASMSHELRTPLNAILGFSEMMEKGIGGTLSEQHRQYIEHIHESGKHLLSIISDILDLSKIEAGQFKLHETAATVSALTESCIQMVRERAMAKNLKLVTQVQNGIPGLTVDPVRIKQILLNLLSNAIKFTDRGTVSLTAAFDPAAGFTFTVTDTGIGMTTAELATAQELFGQVEDAYTRNSDGTGLGLPIARHLAELHGGKLELTSRKSEGTRAVMMLPAHRAIVASSGQNAAAG
jgi:signal transduction histidine kinase